MKISASIYSDKHRNLAETIADLKAHSVDLLHVDCNDDLSVFEDIRTIRTLCDIPVDLHIITDNPEKYMDLLIEVPVEYVTFQYEPLKSHLVFPKEVTGIKGLAITTHTPVSVFSEYEAFDFLLIMATVPGQSGGVFDAVNFKKIRDFKKLYPSKAVHVDGGVNGEVSFILRNMGVESSVSGSYLFNAPSIGHALMNLTKRTMHSDFQLADFMIPLEESPKIIGLNAPFSEVLTAIEEGRTGFVLVLDTSGKLLGLISNADFRKALIRLGKEAFEATAGDCMNAQPFVMQEFATVNELLHDIAEVKFPVLYVPVVAENGTARGIVTFVNLIKGEV